MHDDDAMEATAAVEAIRKRPMMYFGFRDARALEVILEEIVSNAIDEHLAGHAARIEVRLRADGVSVTDDGRGFPLDEPDGLDLLRLLHRRPTADGHAPHVHVQGFAGAGLFPVAAVSERLTVRAWRHGRLLEAVLARGVVIEPPRVIAEGTGRGTTVDFTPDPDIFGDARMRRSVVRGRLFHVAHLFPGLRVHVDDEIFRATGGLGDFVLVEDASIGTLRSATEPFSAECQTDDAWIAAAATGDITHGARRTRWRSWANGSETAEHGSHVDGFRAALRAAGWKPSVAAIHVILKHPRFAGPVKDRLDMPSLARVVHEALAGSVARYLAASSEGRPRSGA